MNSEYSIINHCTIRNNQVIVEDKPVFSFPEAGFKEFSTAVYKKFNTDYPKFYKMDNLCKLGFLTSEILLEDKEIKKRFTGSDTGILLMNSSSSLDTDRNHQETIADRKEYFPSPSIFVYTLPNIVIGEICIRHKITGENIFFIQEKFNPSFLVSYVSYLFDCEIINKCMAGWIEMNGEHYESFVMLVEKSADALRGIVNFDAAVIEGLYNKFK